MLSDTTDPFAEAFLSIAIKLLGVLNDSKENITATKLNAHLPRVDSSDFGDEWKSYFNEIIEQHKVLMAGFRNKHSSKKE